MKIVFMGTPEFARRPLEYLHTQSGLEIVAVVTGPDKPSGRGRKLKPTPVKKAALGLGLSVLTPNELKDNSLVERLKSFNADIFVIVAFRILPEMIFSIPPKGSINLHGSLLPKYRGAAPIQWAIINGETETGLTTFFLKKKVDTGNIIYRERIEIKPDETYDDLAERMSEMAGPVIEKTLDIIEKENFVPELQDDILATPAPKFTADDCIIDWNESAETIINRIRGLSSVPGAFTNFRNKKLKILRAKKSDESVSEGYSPGEIIPDKRSLFISSIDGVVEIIQVVPEGKSAISGDQFIRGYQPQPKEKAGE